MRLFKFADGTVIDLTKIVSVSPIMGNQSEDQMYEIYFESGREMCVWDSRKYCETKLLCQASRDRLISAWQDAVGDLNE